MAVLAYLSFEFVLEDMQFSVGVLGKLTTPLLPR